MSRKGRVFVRPSDPCLQMLTLALSVTRAEKMRKTGARASCFERGPVLAVGGSLGARLPQVACLPCECEVQGYIHPAFPPQSTRYSPHTHHITPRTPQRPEAGRVRKLAAGMSTHTPVSVSGSTAHKLAQQGPMAHLLCPHPLPHFICRFADKSRGPW